MEQQVLSISLKEYKRELDDLRASLLSLEKGSDEYAKTVNEIKSKQQSLNEVMSIGKKDTDALEGSYNALQQQMTALKKEWKATNDEARRNELGQQISALDEQLKGLDASVGQFQRNVGNYAIAGESMKSQLKAMKEEIAKLLAQGIAPTDERMQQLVETAGKLEDAMGDATAMIKQAGNDTQVLSGIIDVAKTGAAAFGLWQSALAAFGVEDDRVVQSIQKLQVAMTALNSLQQIQTALVDKSSKAYQLWNKAVGLLIGTQKTETVAVNSNTTAQNANTVATNAATTATNAFKAALIATGIAAFVVLLGTLVANWDRVKTSILGAKDALKSYNDLANLSTNFKEYQKQENRELARKIELLRAEGKDEKEIIPLQKQYNNMLLDEVTARKSQLELKKQNKGLSEDEQKSLDELTDDYYELININGDLDNSLEAYNIRKARGNEENKKTTKTTKEVKNELKDEAEALKKTSEEIENKIAHANKLKKLKGQLTDIESLAEEEKYYKRQITLWETIAEKYQAMMKKYKEGSKERLDYEKKYQDAAKQVTLNTQGAEIKSIEIVVKKREDALSKFKEEYEKAMGEELDITERVLTKEEQRFESMLLGVKSTIDSFPELMEKESYDYVNGLTKIFFGQQNNKDYDFTEYLEDNYEKAISNLNVYYQRAKDLQEKYGDEAILDGEYVSTRLIELETVRATILAGIRRGSYEEQQEIVLEGYRKMIDAAEGDEKRQAELQAERTKLLTQIKIDADNEWTEASLNNIKRRNDARDNELKAIKAHVKRQIDSYDQLAKSTADLLGSIADVMEENLKRRNDISQEEAEAEFERIKKVQLAQVWLNTIAGAAGGFLNALSSYAPPFSFIIGGIAAATAIAAGIAQHQQIANSSFDSAAAGSGGATVPQVADVQVEPLLNQEVDANQMTALNTEQLTQQQSEQRVYIQQSDITKSNRQVEVRQTTTKF